MGFRTEAIEGLKSTLAIWYLHSASELVFSGDAGTTETSGASTRYGIEWANFYRPSKWLILDADFSFTHARYDQAQLNQASDPAKSGIWISHSQCCGTHYKCRRDLESAA